MKSAVIIVLYNPSVEEVLENIRSYCNEIDAIYFVDNTSTANERFNNVDGVKYMPMYNNLGLCKGLNIGCREAIKDGFDILITMNMDTFCPKGTIKSLISAVENNPEKAYGTNIKLIYRDSKGKRIFSEEAKFPEKNEEIYWTIMSGNAFSSKCFNAVGGFDESLFIDNLDRDFSFRLRRAGFPIVRLGKIFIFQEFGNMTTFNIGIKKLHIANLSPFRYYYIFRNEYYLRKKYKADYNIYKVDLYKYIFSILFFEKDKIKKIKACIKGIRESRKMNYE